MDGYKARAQACVEKCENIRRDVLRGEINVFDMMERTTQITCDIIKSEFRRYAPQKGIAAFVHGSASRNEMVTYSDVDILFIDAESNSDAIKNILRTLVYGFGKIDELEGRQREVIERYVKYSLTDRNKIIFAQFVIGDSSISKWIHGLKMRENTLHSAIENIIFQKYYLNDYYYNNKNAGETCNVKYQDGGTYDLLMYNWFDNAMLLYRGNNWAHEPESNRPKIESTLKNFNRNGILSNTEYERVKAAAEFMILLRNEILHINKNTDKEGIAHLDGSIEKRVLESAYLFFKKQNINTPNELHKTYEENRCIISGTKKHLFKLLLREEEKYKGSKWRRSFDMAERGELRIPTGDSLIDIAMIWGLNRVGDTHGFNNMAKKVNWNWGTCASMACSNLASPDLLESIRSYCQPFPELRYVLRIIARNTNTTKETLTAIAEDSGLGFWSAVAKRRLKDGLNAAINLP